LGVETSQGCVPGRPTTGAGRKKQKMQREGLRTELGRAGLDRAAKCGRGGRGGVGSHGRPSSNQDVEKAGKGHNLFQPSKSGTVILKKNLI